MIRSDGVRVNYSMPGPLLGCDLAALAVVLKANQKVPVIVGLCNRTVFVLQFKTAARVTSIWRVLR